MQKVIRHILAVLGRMLFIGLSIQVVLGIVWICCNLGKFQEFGDSLFYIEVSKSLVYDEYTGILYPVLLMLARGIEGLLRIPYTFVLQLLQLAVAGVCGFCFCESLGVRKTTGKLWGSLVILTFPMVAQCHLALLPYSLAFSAFLWEMSWVLKLFAEETTGKNADWCKVCVGWLLGGLLLPEYLYLGAIPVALLVISSVVKCGKQHISRMVHPFLLIAAFVGMLVALNGLVQQEGAWGRPVKSWESAFFRRVAWTELCEYYGGLPEEMRAVCSYEDVEETAEFADNMERILQPMLELELGVERSGELYREAGMYILSQDTKGILHQIIWDVVGYSLPPVAMQMMLMGRGYDSYVGRNYEIMRHEAPVLTKYYVDYSCWWFVAAIMLVVLAELCLLLQKRSFRILPVVSCLLSTGGFVLWYTLQGAGVWDYKKGLFAGAIWLAWMILRMSQIVGEKDVDEE